MITSVQADTRATTSTSGVSGSSGGSQSSFSETLDQAARAQNGTGYAYTDKYGYCHVVAALSTAREYARDATGPTGEYTAADGETYKVFTSSGKVYQYTGEFAGGYALNDSGGRVALALPGCVDYGNAVKDSAAEETANVELSIPAGVKVFDTLLSNSMAYMKYLQPLDLNKLSGEEHDKKKDKENGNP